MLVTQRSVSAPRANGSACRSLTKDSRRATLPRRCASRSSSSAARSHTPTRCWRAAACWKPDTRRCPRQEAELHVINTCCITGEAEAKSRQSVRRSLKNGAQVYVGGCAVNLRAAQFAEIDDGGAPVHGHGRGCGAGDGGRARRMRGSGARAAGGPRAAKVARGSHAAPAPRSVARQHPHGRAARRGSTAVPRLESRRSGSPAALASPNRPAAARTRGFVKVQDGCDCHCAYCIIPTVRGAARSRPAAAVLEEVRARVRPGPAGDRDDRHQRGRLPRPRGGPGAGRADGRGRAGARAWSGCGSPRWR